MTPDAKIIVFASDAENLIATTAAPLDQNFSTDVYIRDRTTATAKTQRISVATDGTEGDIDSFGGSIGDDGRYMAFMSNSSNFDINDSGIFTDVFAATAISPRRPRLASPRVPARMKQMPIRATWLSAATAGSWRSTAMPEISWRRPTCMPRHLRRA